MAHNSGASTQTWSRSGLVGVLLAAAVLCLVSLAAWFLAGFPQGPGFPPKWSVPAEAVIWTPADSVGCSGPCWRGLVIGKSSEADVMAVLQNLAFINRQSIARIDAWVPALDESFTTGRRISAECLHQTQSNRGCVKASLVKDVLTELYVRPNVAFTLDQAMAVLGRPDYAGYTVQGAETAICDISLVWQDRQLMLSNIFYSTPGDFWGPCETFGAGGQFKVSLPVHEVYYIPRASLEAELRRQGYGHYLPFTESMLLP